MHIYYTILTFTDFMQPLHPAFKSTSANKTGNALVEYRNRALSSTPLFFYTFLNFAMDKEIGELLIQQFQGRDSLEGTLEFRGTDIVWY